MALIIRIDVDRPYGKHPMSRHVLSRISSDLYFPKIQTFGFLDELKQILLILNERKARAYVFFRQCTFPSTSVMNLLDGGKHEIGLHLENSRSFETFFSEKETLERYVGRPIFTVSKHGSGRTKFGRRHYAPYEPEKYLKWAHHSQMKVVFGNLEDPTLEPSRIDDVLFFPSAFWLEPNWRDTIQFSDSWLLAQAPDRDIVLLLHPENVLESPEITDSFINLITRMETRILL